MRNWKIVFVTKFPKIAGSADDDAGWLSTCDRLPKSVTSKEIFNGCDEVQNEGAL